jgi:hypothetical protein
MRYSCKKTAIYKNIKVLCGSAKPIFYLFKTPRVRIYFTRIRLIAAHVTLAHATFNSRRTARLKKRKASYNDRLTSSSRSHNVEKNVRSRVFANKINEKG